MRRLSLLAEDLDMASAQRLGLADELVSGTVAEAQVEADALALAKAHVDQGLKDFNRLKSPYNLQ